MREVCPDIEYAHSAEDALVDASAALMVTEWDGIVRFDEDFDTMETRSSSTVATQSSVGMESSTKD